MELRHQKLYRYTTNGEGVWTAGKRMLPDELVADAEIQRSWLPKPALPNGEYRFYLTEQGMQQYERTLRPVHEKYLPDIQCESCTMSKVGTIVYEDAWQVVANVPSADDRRRLA